MLLKERENNGDYSPVIRKIVELPSLKIRVGDKIILTDAHLKKCISVNAVDAFGRYINLGREVVLLPYKNNQKFILIGVLTDVPDN